MRFIGLLQLFVWGEIADAPVVSQDARADLLARKLRSDATFGQLDARRHCWVAKITQKIRSGRDPFPMHAAGQVMPEAFERWCLVGA